MTRMFFPINRSSSLYRLRSMHSRFVIQRFASLLLPAHPQRQDGGRIGGGYESFIGAIIGPEHDAM